MKDFDETMKISLR